MPRCAMVRRMVTVVFGFFLLCKHSAGSRAEMLEPDLSSSSPSTTNLSISEFSFALSASSFTMLLRRELPIFLAKRRKMAPGGMIQEFDASRVLVEFCKKTTMRGYEYLLLVIKNIDVKVNGVPIPNIEVTLVLYDSFLNGQDSNSLKVHNIKLSSSALSALTSLSIKGRP